MSLEFKEDAACEGCGQFGAYAFDGGQFCGGCYEALGSCCPGWGTGAQEIPVETPCLKPTLER